MRLSRLLAVGLSVSALGASAFGLSVLQSAPKAAEQAASAVPTMAQVVQLGVTIDSNQIATRQGALDAQGEAIQAQAQQLAWTAQVRALAASTDKIIAKQKADAQAKADGYAPGTTSPKEIARQMMQNKFGWGADQFACYDNIIMRESMWIATADNPTSSAYGIPQALPGNRMASEGADWQTNPVTQIKWGLKYVKDRYGTPCAGWSFKRANGWY